MTETITIPCTKIQISAECFEAFKQKYGEPSRALDWAYVEIFSAGWSAARGQK